MKRILFVVNNDREFDCSELLVKYLDGWETEIATELPATPSDYQLIILWNYRKIIKNIPEPNNVIIFHSSDLPEGRGWAPIHYTITEQKEFYVICGIMAAPEVDCGDIVVKARFRILPNHTATILRRFDNEITIMAIRKILERFKGSPLKGAPQRGQATYRSRRSKEDNIFDVNRPFYELISHFRACEPSAPAAFHYRGEMYSVTVSPMSAPAFPEDVEFIFPES